MKTKSLFFAALILISAAVSAAGKDEPKGAKTGIAIVPVKGSETFKLVYKGESAGNVKLNIYDQSQNIILTKTFKSTDGFICPLNFNGLEFGEYTVEVIDGAGAKTQKLVYELYNNTRFVHVSKLNSEESKYLLSVAKTSSPISIRIFDAQDNLIHAEQKEAGNGFAQVYKLAKTSQAYTFEVSDNFGNVKSIKR